jgi:hypothetical protein
MACAVVTPTARDLERHLESILEQLASPARAGSAGARWLDAIIPSMDDALARGRSAPDCVDRGSASRIAVLFERGRTGTAALEQGSAVASRSGAELTVIVLVPQAAASHRCGPSPSAYNCAVLDEATLELREAARLLPESEPGARFRLLIEGADPPLNAWVADEQFDLVVLPARRRLLRPPGHPAVRALRRLNGCDVRLAARPGKRRAAVASATRGG